MVRRRKVKKSVSSFLYLIVVLTIVGVAIYLVIDNRNKTILKDEMAKNEVLSHYNEFVKTSKKTPLYEYENGKYNKVGEIGKEVELSLDKMDITSDTKYFKVNTFDREYYITYSDVEKIDKLSVHSDRYKRYIPFNKNIVTNDKVSLYNENNELVYTLPISLDLPIIINSDNFYGVEYNNRLLYIKNDDIKEYKDSQNTDLKNTEGIAVLNYHFFYNSDDPSDICDQVICLSTNNLKKHLDYIKENNIFTPTLRELEMYIDGIIQLPKSVVLTIDDGWRGDIGSNIMAEYKLNGTVFLMSYHYDTGAYKNEYIEVHSHGHDIHNPGVCPGGQGGAIKCMEKGKLLADLKASREKLDNTTYFCYPFYEYNNYSIEVLKEAGFTMAFGGYMEGGRTRAAPGIDKFRIPRYIIYSYTNVNTIANYIG